MEYLVEAVGDIYKQGGITAIIVCIAIGSVMSIGYLYKRWGK